MKNSSRFAIVVAFAALALPVTPLRAQTPAADVDSPVIVRTAPTTGTNTSSARVNHSGTWIKAQVIHADSVTITVSELKNQRMIHTFTFSDQLKPRMQNIVNAGGYHYGDHVRILFNPQNTIALKIHGKPSKTS